MTRFGRRLPFTAPIPIAEDADSHGWIPGEWKVRGRERTALAPITHYGKTRQQGARRVVLVHNCPQYKALIDEVISHGSEPDRPL